jgi:hypothetical protein
VQNSRRGQSTAAVFVCGLNSGGTPRERFGQSAKKRVGSMLFHIDEFPGHVLKHWHDVSVFSRVLDIACWAGDVPNPRKYRNVAPMFQNMTRKLVYMGQR